METGFLQAPSGRSGKAYIEEGKERMEVKLNIMQIYALFFSIFFLMLGLSGWFCFLLDLYSLVN